MFTGLIQRSVLCSSIPVVIPTWTPASLGSVVKGWWEAGDISTLFQDSAGTTPVTADSQPVGRMSDKSGNGSHIIQTTSGARPLYKTATLPKVTFDGTDDTLGTAADAALADGSGQWFAALAFKFASLGAGKNIMTWDQGAVPMGTPFGTDGSSLLRSGLRRTDTAVINDANATQPGTVNPTVILATAFLSGTGQAELWVDGVSDGPHDAGLALLTTGNAKVNIGDYPGNGTAQAGDLYAGVIGTGVLSPSDRAKLITYLGNLCGRTL
jgi:hypothetical protein